MTRARSTYSVPCPLCGQSLQVDVSPGSTGTRLEPPEGPEIESISGCPCVDSDVSDDYLADICQAVEHAEVDAAEREMDRRLRAWLDGEA